MNVGDLVKYRSRMDRIVMGIIVAQVDPLLTTSVWNIQRIKTNYAGRVIREYTMQGDILEVISESR